MSRITLLVACARNGVIGLDNRMPWHLPEDLAHFKRTTLGHTIVMGRKTWVSIGRALPGRRMIVLSRNGAAALPGLPAGVEGLPSLDAAIADHARSEHAGQELFIVGGADVYRQAMTLADRILMTAIDLDTDGDAFFIEPDPATWESVSRETHTSKTGLRYAIIDWRRREPPRQPTA